MTSKCAIDQYNRTENQTKLKAHALFSMRTPTMSSQVVDQYNTPVIIEVYRNGNLRDVKSHSDLQLAWFWALDRLERDSEEDWYTRYRTFQELAQRMNRRWQQGRYGGVRTFYTQNAELVFYYEPSTDD